MPILEKVKEKSMRKAMFFLYFFIFAVFVYAGDIANFVNLGFSPDGSYFAFGQHGLTDEKYQSYAEIYCIDVKKNDFLPSGTFKITPTLETTDKDSKNIFLSLQDRSARLLSKFKINTKNEGRPIYVITNETLNDKTLFFKDFETGDDYMVILNKEHKSNMEVSFYINLEITKPNGSKIKKEIGQKGKVRAGVKDYFIKKIIIDNTNSGLVFIIEKHVYDKIGNSIRFMVETVKIN